MKTSLLVCFLFFGLVAVGEVQAQMMGPGMMGDGMMGENDVLGSDDEDHNDPSEDEHESIDVVLEELLQKYNVDKVQDLDCDELSEEDLERVGDALMEVMHPGEAHERMDRMMGGEGSESLKNMHVSMGSGYLGCSGYDQGYGMMGGMGMMGRSGNPMDKSGGDSWGEGGRSMMENFSGFPLSIFGSGESLLSGLILLIVIIGGVVFFVIWLKKQKLPAFSGSRQSAMETLKIRYAKGEIRKREFDSKKKDLL
jgi:uncharacterized membrane protein